MKSTAQTISILLAILGSFVWLRMSIFTYYSPQLAGALILIYFLLRLAQKKHFLPLSVEKAHTEFALATAAILLLIGSTGNLYSIFFPLAFVHLFLLTMSAPPKQALALSMAVMLFHLSFVETWSNQAIAQLSSLPLLLFIFLFAKSQYEQTQESAHVIKGQRQLIAKEQSEAVLFLSTFLKPKLEHLLKLSEYPQENHEVIAKQIILIQEAMSEVIETFGEK